jgi:5-methylcytosine-specific restriction endonuclease McrA
MNSVLVVERVAKVSPSLVLDLVDHLPTNVKPEIDGYRVKIPRGERFKTFKLKGIDCVCCGRKGSHFYIQITYGRKDGNTFPGLVLYTDDDVLMTTDHIVPKKYGGMTKVHNLQPMCSPCNNKKADRIMTIEELRETI